MGFPEYSSFSPQEQLLLAQTRVYFLQHHVVTLMENGGIPFVVEIGGEEVTVDQKYVQNELRQLEELGFDLHGRALPIDPQLAIGEAERIIARSRNGHLPPDSS